MNTIYGVVGKLPEEYWDAIDQRNYDNKHSSFIWKYAGQYYIVEWYRQSWQEPYGIDLIDADKKD